MKKIKVGVLGVGDISRVYMLNLKRFSEYLTVEACAARNYEKTKKKAEEYGIPKVYRSPEELIADPEIDMVLNLTIPEVHGKYNIMAAEAGKHVYSEKPIAPTFEEGKKLLQVAKEKGVLVGCAPDTFLGSRLQNCRKIIDDGKLGTVTGATAFMVCPGHEWLHPAPEFFYQPGAGPLMDIGPYYITALLALMGPVKRVCAMGKKSFDQRVYKTGPEKGKVVDVNIDTYTTALLEFDSGAIATVLFSFDIWDTNLPRMEFYGTKGTICIGDKDPYDGPNVFGGETWLRTDETFRWNHWPRVQEKIVHEWPVIETDRPFDSTSHADNSRGIGLVDMILAMQENRPHRASGEMALHALELMDTVTLSAKDHSFYELETTFERPALLPDGFGK